MGATTEMEPTRQIIPLSHYIRTDDPDTHIEIYQEVKQIYKNCVSAIMETNQQLYFSSQEKIPNKCKFSHEQRRQMWINIQQKVRTFTLQEVAPELVNSPNTENIYIHNLNNPIILHMGGLPKPKEIPKERSIKAFNLKGRTLKIYFEGRTKTQ